MACSILLAVLCSSVGLASGLNNGLGRTPQMGYNTWNDFRCDGITSAHIREVVDKMSELGLKELGYEYVNIDDCWSHMQRDGNGRLFANPAAFPEGMKALSDYVHSKGFKLGIYTDRGRLTCAGYPASKGFEQIDAATFADWEIDYLKEDSCYASQVHAEAFYEYTLMRDALNATGRPIFFSLCGWNPWYAPPDEDLHYKGGASVGNSWRIAPDCNDWKTIFAAIQINAKLSAFAGPGGWNDPDMLIGSSPGVAARVLPHQSRTQFSLWSAMAAPLLIGSKLLNLTEYDLQTYSNKLVISVNQDPLGAQARPLVDTCPEEDIPTLVERGQRLRDDSGAWEVPDCHQVWAKPLQSGAMAVVMVNYGPGAKTLHVDFATDLGVPGGVAHAKDVWAQRSLPASRFVEETIGGDGDSAMLLVTPVNLKPGLQDSASDRHGVVVADEVLA